MHPSTEDILVQPRMHPFLTSTHKNLFEVCANRKKHKLFHLAYSDLDLMKCATKMEYLANILVHHCPLK